MTAAAPQWRRWRGVLAERAALRQWRRDGALDARSAAAARAALGPAPDPALWRWFLDRLALWLGVALCAAGAISFIAANWDALDKAVRLYGLQALLVCALASAARLGPARTGGQAALWLAMVLLGGLLALIGQTYQTGADPWELFALWALLSLPWVLAGRHPALWLTWALVADLALGPWLATLGEFWWEMDHRLVVVGLFDLALLCAWRAAARRWPAARGVGGPRLLAAAVLGCLGVAAASAGLNLFGPPRWGIELPAWLLASAVLAWPRRGAHRDRAVLAMAVVCAIVVVDVWLASLAVHHLFDGREPPAPFWLLLALGVMAQAGAGVWWLRRLPAEDVEDGR